MKTAEKVFPAKLEELENVQTFVRESIEAYDCPMKVMFQLDVAVEEIFVNIAHYAYDAAQGGEALVRCTVGGEPCQVVLQFVDGGVPFNPLAKEDADVTLSAEERKIGGLGIYMVKKSMDGMEYHYEDGKNVLTLRKSF